METSETKPDQQREPVEWLESSKKPEEIKTALMAWQQIVRDDYADILADVDSATKLVLDNNGNIVVGRRGKENIGVVVYYSPKPEQEKRMGEQFVFVYLMALEKSARKNPVVFKSLLRVLCNIAEKSNVPALRLTTLHDNNEYLNALYEKISQGPAEMAYSDRLTKQSFNQYRISTERLREFSQTGR